jgi:hypothetical protein
MKDLDKKAVAWKIITLVCGTATGLATDRVLALVWEKSFSREAPTNPADRRTSWPAALSWAVATGVGVGVARVVANRSAAAVWEVAINEAPPGVLTDSPA